MIDLRQGELPTSLVVGGEAVEIDTDFRTWLRVQVAVEETGAIPPIFFKGAVPAGDWGRAAAEFLRSDVDTPHGGSGGGTLDLIRDGDYIVGSFQQAYGIDLTTGGMHWHRFLALLRSLPDGCKMSDIMGYRAWRPTRRKQDAIMRELHNAWSLPRTRHDAGMEAWAREAFGKVEVSDG